MAAEMTAARGRPKAVQFEKLKKQFQRELKTNPKKAAVLGLLVAVALWFWTPLVYRWLSKSKPVARASSASTAAKSSAGGDTAGTKPALDSKPTPTGPAWNVLAERIELEPLMQPVAGWRGKRDPFRRPMYGEEPGVAQQPREAAPVLATPQNAGLVLTGTAVGPRRKVAIISGKAYALGQSVVSHVGEEIVAFRLVEVHPRYVMLERNEQQFQLKIEQPDLVNVTVTDDDEPSGL